MVIYVGAWSIIVQLFPQFVLYLQDNSSVVTLKMYLNTMDLGC